jgi:endonuclease/exonuclease/phosphatase family metal-dependent hydrolase
MNFMPDQPQPDAGKHNLKPRRRLASMLALAGLIGMVVWIASERRPTRPAAGASIEGPAATRGASRSFRVAAFNIHGAMGKDKKADIGRAADLLRNVDLVGLSEVHGGRLGEEDQAAQLGKRLQMPWLFAPAESRWGRNSFGNGLLCSLPVTSWMRIPMPTKGGVAGLRNVILARVQVAGQDVSVLVVHIHRVEDRPEQLRTALALFSSLQPPCVILGDFNTRRGDRELAEFLGRQDVTDAHRGNTNDFPARIDWILTRGLTVRTSQITSTEVSDHPLITAELELSEGMTMP